MSVPPGFSAVLEAARSRARRRVAQARAAAPAASELALGERLVRSAATRAGLWGAATGTLALVTLPLGLPAGVAVTLALEAELILSLLEVYGLGTDGEAGRARLLALWAGGGFAGAARAAGLRAGSRALGRVLGESLPARLLARLNPALLRAVLRRLGLGWLPRALKLWPLLGAPLAFALDRAALRALGTAALATLDDHARASRRAQPNSGDTLRNSRCVSPAPARIVQARRKGSGRSVRCPPPPSRRGGAKRGARAARVRKKPAGKPRA